MLRVSTKTGEDQSSLEKTMDSKKPTKSSNCVTLKLIKIIENTAMIPFVTQIKYRESTYFYHFWIRGNPHWVSY